MRCLLLLFLCLQSGFLPLKAESDEAQTISNLAKNLRDAVRQQKSDSLSLYLVQGKQRLASVDSLEAYISLVKDAAKIYRDELNQADKAVDLYQKALPAELWRNPKNEAEWKAVAWLHVNLAYTYKYGLEEYLSASRHYEMAKQILVERLAIEDLDVGIYIYQEWGNLKTMLGDFAMAEVLLNKFLTIAMAEQAYNTAAEAYNDQGVQLISQWDLTGDSTVLNRAVSYLKKGLTLPNLP